MKMYLLKKQVSVWLIRLRIWIIGETSECGIKPPGSISHGVS